MMAGMDDIYQRLSDRLRDIGRQRAELQEILAFYDKVLEAQRQAQSEIPVPELNISEDLATMKTREGFALVEKERLPVDRNQTLKLFERLCRLSLEENEVLASAAEILLEALTSGTLDFDGLLRGILQEDGEGLKNQATELGVPPAILQALAKLSVQPSLFAVAAAGADRADLENWQRWHCPICASPPAMAALVGEEGKRLALCSFCGHLWHVLRLGCPFCGTTRQEDLRYFYGEGEDLYRVQVCDHCRSYFKVLDTRKGSDPAALAVEDIATGHLDILAEQQGFSRRAPRLWGI